MPCCCRGCCTLIVAQAVGGLQLALFKACACTSSLQNVICIAMVPCMIDAHAKLAAVAACLSVTHPISHSAFAASKRAVQVLVKQACSDVLFQSTALVPSSCHPKQSAGKRVCMCQSTVLCLPACRLNQQLGFSSLEYGIGGGLYYAGKQQLHHSTDFQQGIGQITQQLSEAWRVEHRVVVQQTRLKNSCRCTLQGCRSCVLPTSMYGALSCCRVWGGNAAKHIHDDALWCTTVDGLHGHCVGHHQYLPCTHPVENR